MNIKERVKELKKRRDKINKRIYRLLRVLKSEPEQECVYYPDDNQRCSVCGQLYNKRPMPYPEKNKGCCPCPKK